MRYPSRFIETERTIVVVRVGSRGKRELSLKGYNFQFEKLKISWRWIVEMVVQQYKFT